MQVVDIGDSADRRERRSKLGNVHVGRRAFQQHADGIGHQLRCPRQDEEADAGRDERIRI